MQLNDKSLLKDKAYIDGQWCAAKDTRTFAVTNPANGEQLVQVSDCGAADTEQAVAAAEKSLPAWRAKTAKERSAILRKWFELMMANQEDLAVILSTCLLYTSPSPRDRTRSRMPSSA